MNKTPVVDKEFPNIRLTPEEKAKFVKRRNSMSATKFARWLTRKDPIPYDHGITYVRKTYLDTSGCSREIEDFSEIFERNRAIDRGNREHQKFDAACRYWSSEKGRKKFEEYVKVGEKRWQASQEHRKAIKETGMQMKSFTVRWGLVLIAWFFFLVLWGESTRIGPNLRYFLFG